MAIEAQREHVALMERDELLPSMERENAKLAARLDGMIAVAPSCLEGLTIYFRIGLGLFEFGLGLVSDFALDLFLGLVVGLGLYRFHECMGAGICLLSTIHKLRQKRVPSSIPSEQRIGHLLQLQWPVRLLQKHETGSSLFETPCRP